MKAKPARDSNIARDIAQFVTTFKLAHTSRNVRETAKLHMLDGLACMLGGVNEDASRLVRAYIRSQGDKRESSIVGTRLRTSAEKAALANGVQAHVLDYDDAQLATLPSRPPGQQVHPTAPVLAAILALAEAHNISGAALLSSYIVGVEVACRLGDAIDPSHYLDGFHPTGTLGVFGAAAACGHLLHLDAQQTRRALGIAGSFSSGLRAQHGTMAKALNAGHAAQGGVLAACLAQTGFTASEDIFDDPMGFFAAAAKNGIKNKLLRFGAPFFFEQPGIAVKLYPCPGTLHTALDVLIDLVKEHDVAPEDVTAIRVAMNRDAALPLVYDRPADGLQAKFSLPFTAAVAVLERRVGFDQFTDEKTRAASVRSLMQRIALKKDNSIRGAKVEILLKGGRMLSAQAVIARGHPKAPASRSDIVNKFLQCARGVLSKKCVERFAAQLWNLEKTASVRQWILPLRLGSRP